MNQQPDAYHVFEERLHGAVYDRFRFLRMSHYHGAQGIISKRNASPYSRYQGLFEVQQSYDSLSSRDHTDTGSPFSFQDRRYEKTWVQHSRFRYQTSDERRQFRDLIRGENESCIQRWRTERFRGLDPIFAIIYASHYVKMRSKHARHYFRSWVVVGDKGAGFTAKRQY